MIATAQSAQLLGGFPLLELLEPGSGELEGTQAIRELLGRAAVAKNWNESIQLAEDAVRIPSVSYQLRIRIECQCGHPTPDVPTNRGRIEGIRRGDDRPDTNFGSEVHVGQNNDALNIWCSAQTVQRPANVRGERLYEPLSLFW